MKKQYKEEKKALDLSRVIGMTGLCILATGMIPYRFIRDEETGALEVRSLLWGVRKTPCDGKDQWSFAIPSSGLDMDEEDDLD